MSFGDELGKEVDSIFREAWKTREGNVVPEAEDIQLGNHAVLLDGTVLYADLADSTSLVKVKDNKFAAEVYKAYLISACKIIQKNDGVITAFDGDRVMAIFISGANNTNAAKTALQINHAVRNIINPKMKEIYPSTASNYIIKQSVGVDKGKFLVARTGVRGANDLVWVGKAANYAAKMCSFRENYSSYITEDVFNAMLDEAKYSNSNPRQLMWENRTWTEMGITVYRSNWTWTL